ncbi:MAG: integral membrane sensor signal transduction histidine kinase [Comamonadaceae bacterium]|nr:MAG: integral membrane sensor signal transduction histidine kinase [Comamonadaceae bacterium]
MRLATRVCCSLWPRVWPWLLLGLGVLALVLMLPEQGTGIRLTEAARLQTDTQEYQLPDPVVDAGKLGGGWQAVTLPHASPLKWQRQPLHPAAALTQLTWYRLQIPQSGQPVSQFYLFIPCWKSDGTLAIYADGVLAYQSHANLSWNGANQPRWIALPNTSQSGPVHELLIRVQHVRGSAEGLSSVWFGTHEALYPRYARLDFVQTQLGAISSAAFLATGVFAFLIWLTRRSEPIYLLFFLMSAFYFMCSMHSYVGENRLLLSDEWFGWVTVNSTLWMLCTFHLFLAQLHGRFQKGLTRALLVSSAFMGLITVPEMTGPANASAISLLSYLWILLLGVVVCSVGIWNSMKKPSRDGLLLAGWGGLIVLSGFADWLMQSNVIGIENVFLTKHASVGIEFVFWYIMLHRYIEAMHRVENANEILAQRLKAREAELASSHERLRIIEQQETVSKERKRMMQDMHDGLGSSLRMALWSVEKGKGEANVADVLKNCIDDLKLAIDAMEPVQADLLLLLATWRFRLEPRLEATGITLRWEVVVVPPLDWLDPKSALHILRILQEALTNIIKHANATEIHVATAVQGEHVRVSITDNGQGFPQDATQRGGKGLSNQMRRAEAIGAQFQWRSSSAGTCVSLQLPIKKIALTPTIDSPG